MAGIGGDQTLTPEYPGHQRRARHRRLGSAVPGRPEARSASATRTTGSDHAAPKAFVPLAAAQRLWGARFGALTSLRVAAPAGDDRSLSRASWPGPVARRRRHRRAAASRAEAIEAAAGHHRLRRVLPLLQLLPRGVGAAARRPLLPARRRAAPARGRPAARHRLPPSASAALFMREGAVLAASARSIGVAGAIGYARADHATACARGGSAPSAPRRCVLHVEPLSLAVGAVGGFVAAIAVLVLRCATSAAPLGARAAEGRHSRRSPRARAAGRRARALAARRVLGRAARLALSLPA